MAKQRPVKCPYCGQMIDRDYEFDWKKIGNRYWHDECYAKSQEDEQIRAPDIMRAIIDTAQEKTASLPNEAVLQNTHPHSAD